MSTSSTQYKIRYAYKKPEHKSWASRIAHVKATTESGAITIIEGKHPGCDIEIRSIEIES
ncbi:hypothetical protein DYGSA30_43710 [Dyella sp. GSA-30]|nr:hypothetical protein DYGSA30_43710 [Dyella sp. GSA-30]